MHHYQPIPDLESGDIPPSAITTSSPTTDSKNEKDVESQIPPLKYESHNEHEENYPPSSPSSPTATLPPAPQYPAALRKPWVILSLPIAIAVLISTSVFVCMSSSSSSSAYVASVYPAAIGQQQQQQDSLCASGESSFPFGGDSGVLSSSSWPRIPLSPIVVVDVVPIPESIVSDASSTSDRDTTFHSPAAMEAVVAQPDEAIGMNENGSDDSTSKSDMGPGGIEIISVVDPVVTSAAEVVMVVEVDTEQQARESLREDDYEDDDEDEKDDEKDGDGEEEWNDDDEEEWEDDDEEEDDEDEKVEVQDDAPATMAILEQVAALEALIDQAIPVPETDNDNDEMNLDLGEDGVGMGDGDSVVLLSLRKYDGDDEGEEEEAEDEDEQDHFPTNIGKDDDGEDDGEDEGDEDDQQDGKPIRKGGKDTTNNNSNIGGGSKNQSDEKTGGGKETNKHKHKHQNHNANLGGTGGNGPILLCSSKSCLPSLRDSILSKLSIQVRQVMDHLRSQHTLVHMMSSTAPQTKESLMAGQEELVQQLEDRIMKDLRDWVNGVGRHSSKSGGKKATGAGTSVGGTVGSDSKPGPLAAESTQSVDKEGTVDTEGLFLDGSEFEEGEDDGSGEGFHMASLSFEDADDDDEDHEDEPLAHKSAHTSAAVVNKNKPNKKIDAKLIRRDTSSSSSSHSTGTATSPASPEYFLSADKLLMRQEWSHWIAHWVHHTKLLILSHTLAIQSLVEMNRIAVSGENVIPRDQRHWSWNLDKALATVMVASEMICGGPASAKDVKVFLSTLPMSSESAVTATGSGGDGGSSEGMMSPKALAITLNAQKCIESWSDELEEILQRTAINA
ncbi:MAG: hypothetical protein JOS17DRAFT_790549 [Linnemannia elongata]|nr:MAG: hypothetical protein JOS17DRAFT_790549 [Linnemannia elongata]